MKVINILVLLVLLLLIGCSTEITSFESGAREMKVVNEKYGVDFKTLPAEIEKAVLMRNDLKVIEGKSSNAPESFKQFFDYRMKTLESTIIHLEAWKHGEKASVRDGFGCKSLPIIFNSSILRNASAQRGYEALEVLQNFIDKYPEEAASINITQRDVVFSNAFYYEVEREAGKDRRIIEHFCGHKYDLETLEMKEEFK